MDTSKPIVEVKGLTRCFGENIALEEVNFTVAKGRVYGLVGANGAGKTTLLKHLLGLHRPQSGTVRVFGYNPITHPVEVLQRVGYLSEFRELPEWMLLSELMRYLKAYHPKWDMNYANELIQTFNLNPRKKISELSQGMRAQTGLIAALAHRPELLILDEPSNGLDAMVRMDIIDAIIRTVTEEGRSVIFSSHLLGEMERTSDHVTMIHNGQVRFDGDLEQIKDAHLFTNVSFNVPLDKAPAIEGVLMVKGAGRSWSMLHTSTFDHFSNQVYSRGGDVGESRNATLEEVFIAYADRKGFLNEGAMK